MKKVRNVVIAVADHDLALRLAELLAPHGYNILIAQRGDDAPALPGDPPPSVMDHAAGSPRRLYC